MTNKTIEVDVPNGYETYKIEYFSDIQYIKFRLKEKTQPRRIVFEEIESRIDINNLFINGKWWREVKETDIPLNSDEPKLSLSMDECKNILGYGDYYQHTLNKLAKFIKENS